MEPKLGKFLWCNTFHVSFWEKLEHRGGLQLPSSKAKRRKHLSDQLSWIWTYYWSFQCSLVNLVNPNVTTQRKECTNRNSHQVFWKINILKVLKNNTKGPNFKQNVAFDFLTLLCKCIEITPRLGCSPVNLLHIFRTPFPKNTSRRLLLFLRIFEQLFLRISLIGCYRAQIMENMIRAAPKGFSLKFLFRRSMQ